jgi:hypothetical protein
MSGDAKVYVDGWIVENLHLLADEPETDETIARPLAILCSIEADLDGFSVREIEAAVSNLADYIAATRARYQSGKAH